MRPKPLYISPQGLIRCGMCSIRDGEPVYLQPSAFSEGMQQGARLAAMGMAGRCIICLDCYKTKQVKEFYKKAETGKIKPEYGEHDRTFGHPKPGDELYRMLVFPKPQQNRITND
jgi:hypothetical protein